MAGLEDTSSSAGHLIGDYIRGEVIAEGGFGKVYKAQHRYLAKQACIKVIRPDHQSEELADFLMREADVLNTLDHKHIVRLLGLTIEDDQINFHEKGNSPPRFPAPDDKALLHRY
jgi:serine/threonine protein kinase